MKNTVYQYVEGKDLAAARAAVAEVEERIARRSEEIAQLGEDHRQAQLTLARLREGEPPANRAAAQERILALRRRLDDLARQDLAGELNAAKDRLHLAQSDDRQRAVQDAHPGAVALVKELYATTKAASEAATAYQQYINSLAQFYIGNEWACSYMPLLDTDHHLQRWLHEAEAFIMKEKR